MPKFPVNNHSNLSRLLHNVEFRLICTPRSSNSATLDAVAIRRAVRWTRSASSSQVAAPSRISTPQLLSHRMHADCFHGTTSVSAFVSIVVMNEHRLQCVSSWCGQYRVTFHDAT